MDGLVRRLGDPTRDRAHVDRTALAMWPGLDRRALARCRHNPNRIVRLVSRSTRLPEEVIHAILSRPLISHLERETWFG